MLMAGDNLPVSATDRKAGIWLWWPCSTCLPFPPRSCPVLRLGGWVKGRGSARVSDAAGALEAATQGADHRWAAEGDGSGTGGQWEWLDDLLGSPGWRCNRHGVVICSSVSCLARGEGSQPYLGPRRRGGAGDMMMDWVSPVRGRRDRSFFRGRPRWPCTAGHQWHDRRAAGAGRVGTSVDEGAEARTVAQRCGDHTVQVTPGRRRRHRDR
jgi:hypothetical protein